ncbi:MAG: potassium transporter Kup [Betaproteobacteria bacterium]|nr:potassium transporter Kup [Betaproteobacteria bacterium]
MESTQPQPLTPPEKLAATPQTSPQSHRQYGLLALAALGVVYGDIGTSPLYTIKAMFDPSFGIPFTAENILGGLSALFWSLMLVVSLKYVMLMMRADDQREGGIMALLSLASTSVKDRLHWRTGLTLLGVFGAALFYGDSVITPAVTVLGAMEGLEIATPLLKPYVVPLSVVVIVALFVLQHKGTATVGALFGPVMLLWFGTLAVSGVLNMIANPHVLQALSPMHALRFATQHGFGSFIVLGAVFLAVTGAEALYADMGHFGKQPIRLAWFFCAFPALVLNYFGQGALLIANPKALENPFFLMFPSHLLYPVVVLATVAAAIASQAVISGTYSMTRQAIQLGFLPRGKVVQTSAKEIGQIYMPVVNWTLMLGVLAAAIGFGSSTTLTFAYGLAVSGTMLITTVLTFFVLRYGWQYNLLLCLLSTGFFLVIDTAFFSASSVKLVEGGWFPLAMGATMFTIMTTWKRGRAEVAKRTHEWSMPLRDFVENVGASPPTRVPNTAVFMTVNSDAVPKALLHNMKHNQVLHERIVVLTIVNEDIPRVPEEDYIWIEDLGHGFWRSKGHYGFKETPDVPQLLKDCGRQGLHFDLMQTSFFLNRETLVLAPGKGLARWRRHLFIWMSHLATKASDYYRIPSNRVIELGTQVQI